MEENKSGSLGAGRGIMAGKEDLTAKVTLEERPRESRGTSHRLSRARAPSRSSRKCKGPEVKECRASAMTSVEDFLAGTE